MSGEGRFCRSWLSHRGIKASQTFQILTFNYNSKLSAMSPAFVVLLGLCATVALGQEYSPTYAGTCVDSTPDCVGWSKRGECIGNNSKWMLQNCRKSCFNCVTNRCVDWNTQCVTWSRQGECKNNPTWMGINCRKSCNNCDAPCVDYNQNCQTWARKGECQRNPNYMHSTCVKSCGMCL